MITYNRLNDPMTYTAHVNDLGCGEEKAMPAETAFAMTEMEKIIHVETGYRYILAENLYEELDEKDLAIIDAVAVSKYLTSLEIYEFVRLKGVEITRDRLRKKLLKMMKMRVLQEYEIHSPQHTSGLKFYELDHWGSYIAKERNVYFHRGNCYYPRSRKQAMNIPDDTAYDVKRVLAGNQIILGLLKNHVQMNRFGIMETMRNMDAKEIAQGCMIRTTAYVQVDAESVLAYEVVRDIPEAYESLRDKVIRYYEILKSSGYLSDNFHGDAVYPQLILCGQSLDHNRKIASYLREEGLWRKEDPILFTEDLLNIRDSEVSIYGLIEDDQ